MDVWGENGLYPGQYKRHSVDRDIKGFIGWPVMHKLYEKIGIKNEDCKDTLITAFECAGRINETLHATKDMFHVTEDFILVKDFPLSKRWKKIDTILICQRCDTENTKFESVCVNCGANLIFSAKKKYQTQKLNKKRLDFFIPLTDPLANTLINRIDTSDHYLFPSPYTDKPYTRQWAYNIVKPYGKIVGLDGLYNHWFRSQRLMQLGNEKGFTEDELKAFSGIIKSETLSKYVKKIQSYTQKMGLQINPELLQGE